MADERNTTDKPLPKPLPKKRPDPRGKFKPVRETGNSPFGGFDNGGGSPAGGDDGFKRTFRLLIYGAVIIGAFILVSRLFPGPEQAEPEISYNEYRRLLTSDFIEECIIEKSQFGSSVMRGVLKKYEDLTLTNRTHKQTLTFRVKLPEADLALVNELTAKNIRVTINEPAIDWTQELIGFLPWVLIGVFYFTIMRRMNAQNGAAKNVFNFGRSRAKMVTEADTKVTFSDVAGADEAKGELEEIVEFLREPEKYQKLGGKIPRGVLLLGAPGTGKTLLAKAVAGEAGVPFFSMSGADFVEMFVGVGASRVRDLFEQAKRNAPCIIFIDEIDAVGRQRGAGLGGGHDEREQTLNQLLVEMDGFSTTENVILIAATNRPDVLDSALLRPGRFDRQVVVDKPDIKGREAILKIHTRNVPLGEDANLKTIAKGTPGFAGADLANLVNEATLLAARRSHENITNADLEDARDKVMMGAERKSAVISPKDKEVTSYHESGHVLVAKFTEGSDPVHKVTIIPRGRALGITSYLPEDKHTYTRKYLLAMITYALGGRAAEEIIYNEISTGAGNDIERATELARKMVCEWGMSDAMGPLSYGAKQQEVFLGRDMGRARDYSEDTAVAIDAEIKRIISECMQNARDILIKHTETLHRLAKILIEKETLSNEEIDRVIADDGNAVSPSAA
ncbi:MAG: ATP-dependent zinc metalloprotease FtsH [Rhizobacter sp.]|nr:ATP-dependent zinc metalloprotease FtsH [Chlorobiales bacterium]